MTNALSMDDRRRYMQSWIADEMTRLREASGLTLREMGALMGRSANNYHKYEQAPDRDFRAINLADYMLLVMELDEAKLLAQDDPALLFVNAIVPRRNRRRPK